MLFTARDLGKRRKRGWNKDLKAYIFTIHYRRKSFLLVCCFDSTCTAFAFDVPIKIIPVPLIRHIVVLNPVIFFSISIDNCCPFTNFWIILSAFFTIYLMISLLANNVPNKFLNSIFFAKAAPYIRFILFDSFRFISIYFFTQNHPFVWEINSVCIEEEFHFVVDKILSVLF